MLKFLVPMFLSMIAIQATTASDDMFYSRKMYACLFRETDLEILKDPIHERFCCKVALAALMGNVKAIALVALADDTITGEEKKKQIDNAIQTVENSDSLEDYQKVTILNKLERKRQSQVAALTNSTAGTKGTGADTANSRGQEVWARRQAEFDEKVDADRKKRLATMDGLIEEGKKLSSYSSGFQEAKTVLLRAQEMGKRIKGQDPKSAGDVEKKLKVIKGRLEYISELERRGRSENERKSKLGGSPGVLNNHGSLFAKVDDWMEEAKGWLGEGSIFPEAGRAALRYLELAEDKVNEIFCSKKAPEDICAPKLMEIGDLYEVLYNTFRKTDGKGHSDENRHKTIPTNYKLPNGQTVSVKEISGFDFNCSFSALFTGSENRDYDCPIEQAREMATTLLLSVLGDADLRALAAPEIVEAIIQEEKPFIGDTKSLRDDYCSAVKDLEEYVKLLNDRHKLKNKSIADLLEMNGVLSEFEVNRLLGFQSNFEKFSALLPDFAKRGAYFDAEMNSTSFARALYTQYYPEGVQRPSDLLDQESLINQEERDQLVSLREAFKKAKDDLFEFAKLQRVYEEYIDTYVSQPRYMVHYLRNDGDENGNGNSRTSMMDLLAHMLERNLEIYQDNEGQLTCLHKYEGNPEWKIIRLIHEKLIHFNVLTVCDPKH